MNPTPFVLHHFEGKPLVTLAWRGQLAWIARQVGDALGYPNRGRRLVSRLGGDWADDLQHEVDYVLLVGADMVTVKAMLAELPGVLPERASHLTLLLKPGLHTVLARTDRPEASRLAAFLACEVLPAARQIDLNWRVEPAHLPDEEEPAPAPAADHGTQASAPAADLEALRELRLAKRSDVSALRVDLEDRRFRSQSVRDTARQLWRLGRLDDDALAHCELAATEIALGAELHLPSGKAPAGWRGLRESAQQLGVGLLELVVATGELGLNGIRPGLSNVVVRPSRRHDGWCISRVLSPAAVQRIRAYLSSSDAPSCSDHSAD